MLRPPGRPPLVRTALALLAVAAVAASAGCGADAEPADDQQAVRDVITRFGEASRAGDYQTICDELLSQTLIQKVQAIGLPCETALQKGLSDVRNPRLEVRDVAVSGGRALASVHSTADDQPPSDDAMQLVREDGSWRIASLASDGDPGTSTSTTPSTTGTTPRTSSVPTVTHGASATADRTRPGR